MRQWPTIIATTVRHSVAIGNRLPAFAGHRGKRMNFAEMWSPGAAADAALDVSVAELLWRDVEKRRKNAWLRPIGFVARLFVYMAFFLGCSSFSCPRAYAKAG
jgi:hypothetical protein